MPISDALNAQYFATEKIALLRSACALVSQAMTRNKVLVSSGDRNLICVIGRLPAGFINISSRS